MAEPDRQDDGMDSGTFAPWSRCRACGAPVRLDRCGDAVAAGDVAGRCRQNTRARLLDEECKSGGAGDQFARRFAGAVAPNLLADAGAFWGKVVVGTLVLGCGRG